MIVSIAFNCQTKKTVVGIMPNVVTNDGVTSWIRENQCNYPTQLNSVICIDGKPQKVTGSLETTIESRPGWLVLQSKISYAQHSTKLLSSMILYVFYAYSSMSNLITRFEISQI